MKITRFNLSTTLRLILLITVCSLSLQAKTKDYVSTIKSGYSAAKAYELRQQWSVPKFIVTTEPGAYSYLHLGEFLPQANILRDGDIAKLEEKKNPSIGTIKLTNTDNSSLSFEKMINAKSSPVQGVIVLHHGKIVFEQYPGMRKNDNHVWMSNAKPVASLLIAQLEDEGKINVNQKLSSYMKQVKGSDWENIKIIDLLNMQTGLDLIENSKERSDPNSGISQFYASEVGAPNNKGLEQTHNEALFSIKALHEPGNAFEYSSAVTQMLGLLAEEVSGKRLADLISQRIWQHAGMKGDATLALTPQGNGIIHGLISSRLIDMARFGLLHTPSWHKTASKQIVSDNTLTKIQHGGTDKNYMKGTLGPYMAKVFREQPLNNSYQWDAIFSDGDIYKSGMNGQGLYVSPNKDIVIAWFATGYADIPMEAFARKIAKQLNN
ncbi:MAG: CubicO group peptidase (beta-lactamase class C family) [Colwellia sp.]|jgi:CubicO group peptidase (beta-lactamase class C family)